MKCSKIRPCGRPGRPATGTVPLRLRRSDRPVAPAKWPAAPLSSGLTAAAGTGPEKPLQSPGIFVCALFLAFFLALPAFAEVTEQQVKEVAKELACLCGDCPRRPLDECACGWADRNRARIAQALESGQDKKAVVASFIQDFGTEALVVPPAEGFNLTAWVMPFLMLVLGAFVVRAVLKSWARPAPASPAGPETGSDDTYRARLERELKEREL